MNSSRRQERTQHVAHTCYNVTSTTTTQTRHSVERIHSIYGAHAIHVYYTRGMSSTVDQPHVLSTKRAHAHIICRTYTSLTLCVQTITCIYTHVYIRTVCINPLPTGISCRHSCKNPDSNNHNSHLCYDILCIFLQYLPATCFICPIQIPGAGNLNQATATYEVRTQHNTN